MASSPESDENKYLFDSDGYYEREMNEEESPSAPIVNTYLDDSDDEHYNDGFHQLNEEETIRYYQAVEESEGFDVPYFPKAFAFGIITPLGNVKSEETKKCAELAIQHYNNENGTSLEFVRMVKANSGGGGRGELFYLTFQVKNMGTPLDSPTTTFQARVRAGISPDDYEVQLCRPKPST